MPSNENTIHVAIELSTSIWLVSTRLPGAAKCRMQRGAGHRRDRRAARHGGSDDRVLTHLPAQPAAAVRRAPAFPGRADRPDVLALAPDHRDLCRRDRLRGVRAGPGRGTAPAASIAAARRLFRAADHPARHVPGQRRAGVADSAAAQSRHRQRADRGRGTAATRLAGVERSRILDGGGRRYLAAGLLRHPDPGRGAWRAAARTVPGRPGRWCGRTSRGSGS